MHTCHKLTALIRSCGKTPAAEQEIFLSFIGRCPLMIPCDKRFEAERKRFLFPIRAPSSIRSRDKTARFDTSLR